MSATETVLDPLVSEFDTQEQADSYDQWLRASLQAAIDDPSPRIPHDQVMSEMDELIDQIEREQLEREAVTC